MLAATAAGLGNVALAQAPLRSLRPEARAAAASSGVKSAITAASVVGAHKLSGLVGCALVDPLNGEILDQHFPELQLPPASVTKAITAAFGLQNLGPKYCFETRLHVVGKVSEGLLLGDLMLIGSADPTLHTDDLVRFAKALHKTDIRRVEGRLLIVDDGFAYLREIDHNQLPQANYNPAVSGFNLNLNRVQFEWERRANGRYDVSMRAPGHIYRPQIPSIQMQTVARSSPSYTYAHSTSGERWSVQRSALGKDGGRWLPTRNPRLYAGEAFQGICAEMGLIMPSPTVLHERYNEPAAAVEIARKSSKPYTEITRSMLKMSTNLTAEVIGLTASDAPNLERSVAALTRFAEAHGMVVRLLDHSGLSDRSRLSAGGLARFMAWQYRNGLPDLLKHKVLRDRGKPIPDVQLRAKTGTLNFVSTMSGYLTHKGQTLGFAILTADLERRARAQGGERPRGAKSWEARSRSLQYAVLRNWLKYLG